MQCKVTRPLQNLSKMHRSDTSTHCRRRILTPKASEFRGSKTAWTIIKWISVILTGSPIIRRTLIRWILNWVIIIEFNSKNSKKVTALPNMSLRSSRIVTPMHLTSRLFSPIGTLSSQHNAQINWHRSYSNAIQTWFRSTYLIERAMHRAKTHRSFRHRRK
jgi:hypothetical protein